MFSKAELEFLKGKNEMSEGYTRVLHHRITKKLENFKEVLPFLIEEGYQIPYVSENSNGVTEFSNTPLANSTLQQSEHTLKNGSFSPNTFSVNAFPKRLDWRRERDSNPHRP
jgi:hypothetical protein